MILKMMNLTRDIFHYQWRNDNFISTDMWTLIEVDYDNKNNTSDNNRWIYPWWPNPMMITDASAVKINKHPTRKTWINLSFRRERKKEWIKSSCFARWDWCRFCFPFSFTWHIINMVCLTHLVFSSFFLSFFL